MESHAVAKPNVAGCTQLQVVRRNTEMPLDLDLDPASLLREQKAAEIISDMIDKHLQAQSTPPVTEPRLTAYCSPDHEPDLRCWVLQVAAQAGVDVSDDETGCSVQLFPCFLRSARFDLPEQTVLAQVATLNKHPGTLVCVHAVARNLTDSQSAVVPVLFSLLPPIMYNAALWPQGVHLRKFAPVFQIAAHHSKTSGSMSVCKEDWMYRISLIELRALVSSCSESAALLKCNPVLTT